uniref:C3H1-type domain-containing protein n=1 Tax=viral metagenome TaxID=1070528 RepID=A0A6C0DZY1_9ZZZZ
MNTQQATCRFFSTIQGCRNRSECNFSHTEQIQQKQPQQRQERQQRQQRQECQEQQEQQGQCPLQQRQEQHFQQRYQPRFQQRPQQRPQQHFQQRSQQYQERKPTVLCKFFPNCNKGSLCTFLHPQEKQEKQENQEPQEKQEKQENQEPQESQESQESQEKQEKIIVSNPPSAKGTNKLIRYCHFFNSIKGCRNGDNCGFEHQEYQD